MTDAPVLLIEHDPDDGFITLTMNRPEKLNALDLELLDAIDTAVCNAQKDPNIRAIILTGAGRAFTTGFDLVSDDFEMDTEGWRADMSANCTRLRRIWSSEVPVIAAINNLALGGGCELAMSCDIRISSDRARFGQPEVWLGLLPAWGGSTRLPQLVGPGKAKEMIFTGQMINAQQAQRDGLVDKIVPDGEEVRAAIDIGRMIARKSAPLAVAHSKRVINENLRASSRDQAMQNEVDAAGTLAASEDLIEGITAFIEKRAPEFQGK